MSAFALEGVGLLGDVGGVVGRSGTLGRLPRLGRSLATAQASLPARGGQQVAYAIGGNVWVVPDVGTIGERNEFRSTWGPRYRPEPDAERRRAAATRA